VYSNTLLPLTAAEEGRVEAVPFAVVAAHELVGGFEELRKRFGREGTRVHIAPAVLVHSRVPP
jgi:hypothetical protein